MPISRRTAQADERNGPDAAEAGRKPKAGWTAVLQKPAARALRSLQARALYRRLARRLAPGVTVREADGCDLRAAGRRLALTGPEQVEGAGPGVTCWVACRGRRLLGFVELACRGPEAGPHAGCWLHGMKVRPLSRGAGIGEALGRAVIGRAAAQGADRLFLTVAAGNRGAVALYRKLGFEQVRIEGLDRVLEKEAAVTGRRRLTMALRLPAGGKALDGNQHRKGPPK